MSGIIQVLAAFGAAGGGGPPPTASEWSTTDQTNVVVSGAGLIATCTGLSAVRSTTSRNSGKRQINFRWLTDTNSLFGLGTAAADITLFPGIDSEGFSYYGVNGNLNYAGSGAAAGMSAVVLNDWYGFVFDFATGVTKVYKDSDGTLKATNTLAPFIGLDLFLMWGGGSSSGSRAVEIDPNPSVLYDSAIAWDT